jgi:hypothetical protein
MRLSHCRRSETARRSKLRVRFDNGLECCDLALQCQCIAFHRRKSALRLAAEFPMPARHSFPVCQFDLFLNPPVVILVGQIRQPLSRLVQINAERPRRLVRQHPVNDVASCRCIALAHHPASQAEETIHTGLNRRLFIQTAVASLFAMKAAAAVSDTPRSAFGAYSTAEEVTSG